MKINVEIRDVSTSSSLPLLRPGEMINDEIVEAYTKLIRESCSSLISTTQLLEPYTTKQNLIDREESINLATLRGCGQLFIPIHLELHWTFAHIQPNLDGSLFVNYHDSMGGAAPSKLRQWLEDRFANTDFSLFEATGPKQLDLVDCGLFMLMGIRLLALGSQHLTQSEADEIIPVFRDQVLASILAGTLDPSHSDYEDFIERDRVASLKRKSPESDTPNSNDVLMEIDVEQWLKSAPSSLDRHAHLRLESRAGSGYSQAPVERELHPQLESSIPKLAPLDIPVTQAIHHTLKVDSMDLENSNSKTADEASPTLNNLAGTLSLNTVQFLVVGDPVEVVAIEQNKKLRHVYTAAASFAGELGMVKMLKEAVLAYRSQTFAAADDQSLAALWKNLNCEEGQPNTVMQRHQREVFSCQFSAELERFTGQNSRSTSKIRRQMQNLLGCGPNKKVFQAAQKQASRARFWTELITLFQPYLLEPRVAIAASSESTTFLESMPSNEKEVFYKILRARLTDPEDKLLPTLSSASALFMGVIEKTLSKEIALEQRQVTLNAMGFAAAVSVTPGPWKLQIPRYVERKP